jgi:hypothetical protein
MSGPVGREPQATGDVVAITPTPSDEEAAAITAAVMLVIEGAQSAARAAASAASVRDDTLHLWVEASRRSAQRAGLQRGPWRLSGRIARRARA